MTTSAMRCTSNFDCTEMKMKQPRKNPIPGFYFVFKSWYNDGNNKYKIIEVKKILFGLNKFFNYLLHWAKILNIKLLCP